MKPPAERDLGLGRDVPDGDAERQDRAPRVGLRGYIAILLAIAIAPVGAVGIFQTVVSQRESDALREEALFSEAVEATAAGTQAIAEAFGVLATLADLVPAVGGESCNRFLADVTDERPRYVLATVIDRRGEVVCASSPGIALGDIGGREFFDEMLSSQRRLVRSFDGGDFYTAPVLQMSVPIHHGPELVGFLTLAMPRSFLQILTDEPGDRLTERDALFDRSGFVFAFSSHGRRQTDWLPPRETLADWALETPRRSVRFTPADGIERAYVTVPVVSPDVFAVASWPVAESDRAAEVRLALAVIFPLAMWAVSIGIAFFAVNALLLRNVLKLGRTMSAFARGRRSVRMVPAEGAPSEFVTLGESFNRLADRIEADEAAMANAIEEKNTLLREVYHRVKNNLQLIVSLLNLQIRQSGSEAERDALRRLQNRVQGLALVHRRLYLAQNLSAVRMDLLLADLIPAIRDTHRITGERVEVDVRAEPVTLEPDRAVPLALFASEALVNAFKHGWSPACRGHVEVRLEAAPECYRLEIANTVSGRKPVRRETEAVSGLGARLLDSFARQLLGELTVEREEKMHRVTLVIPRVPAYGTGESQTAGNGAAPETGEEERIGEQRIGAEEAGPQRGSSST